MLGVAGLSAALAAAVLAWDRNGRAGRAERFLQVQPVALNQALPDPLDGGVAWLNTAGPIKLRELKGKIVILDFWTYCCINCHHMLPVLAKIEHKYPNEVVVIGVHTPKFLAEQDTDNIRRKVHEYNVKHPVINDANMTVWNAFDVHSWPTLVVIGPKGTELARQSGELPFEVLDQFVAKTIADSKADLDLTPVKFFPENEKPYNTPLLFPGKVVADAATNRLIISDTGHNRIILTDLAGKKPVIVGDGSTGFNDGPFEKASFNRPQGTALVGDHVYVADTENHAIRDIGLKARTVTTIAGTGQQSQAHARVGATGPGKTTALSSPWDIAHVPGSRVLYIAMAGPHQIWKLDLADNHVGVFAGTGNENITDGPAESAAFAQPSGLATDGAHLFVADSEVSAVRTVTLTPGSHKVGRVVGEGLFEFGDRDGRGSAVRLQHCLGVAYAKGKLYIADTYNNKIKVSEPLNHTVKTLVGTVKPGDSDNPPAFYQPGGLSVAGDKLYVADTNNGKIKVVDLKTDQVSTLVLDDLNAPKPAARSSDLPEREGVDPRRGEGEAGEDSHAGRHAADPRGLQAEQRPALEDALRSRVVDPRPDLEGVPGLWQAGRPAVEPLHRGGPARKRPEGRRLGRREALGVVLRLQQGLKPLHDQELRVDDPPPICRRRRRPGDDRPVTRRGSLSRNPNTARRPSSLQGRRAVASFGGREKVPLGYHGGKRRPTEDPAMPSPFPGMSYTMKIEEKAVLERIEALGAAVTKARQYLESGAHADWHGFRPLFVDKLRDGKPLPPHKDWVKNVFLPRQEAALNRAERLLERLQKNPQKD
ncbi:MAG: thioredoxin-like domain-containing protein [Isosphaeraceae bacterium]